MQNSLHLYSLDQKLVRRHSQSTKYSNPRGPESTRTVSPPTPSAEGPGPPGQLQAKLLLEVPVTRGPGVQRLPGMTHVYPRPSWLLSSSHQKQLFLRRNICHIHTAPVTEAIAESVPQGVRTWCLICMAGSLGIGSAACPCSIRRWSTSFTRCLEIPFLGGNLQNP